MYAILSLWTQWTFYKFSPFSFYNGQASRNTLAEMFSASCDLRNDGHYGFQPIGKAAFQHISHPTRLNNQALWSSVLLLKLPCLCTVAICIFPSRYEAVLDLEKLLQKSNKYFGTLGSSNRCTSQRQKMDDTRKGKWKETEEKYWCNSLLSIADTHVRHLIICYEFNIYRIYYCKITSFDSLFRKWLIFLSENWDTVWA